MPNTPLNQQNPAPQKRICDFCGKSPALLYCRADSAKLCFSCDKEVHSTNPLFTKHKRFQLCDVCDESPASILCCTEHSVLCQNCDFEAHSEMGIVQNHERRPLDGFSGCPSAYELSGVVGIDDFDVKWWGNDEFEDLLKWDDNHCVVSIDELIASTSLDHCFQPLVVRPLSKDRNLYCGQHKQEILNQLYKLAKSDTNTEHDINHLIEHRNFSDENKDLIFPHILPDDLNYELKSTLRGHEPRSWGNDEANEVVNDIFVSSALSEIQYKDDVLHSDKPSCGSANANVAVNVLDPHDHVGSEPTLLPHISKVAIHEFSRAERHFALSRYKEKKRTRRYTIWVIFL